MKQSLQLIVTAGLIFLFTTAYIYSGYSIKVRSKNDTTYNVLTGNPAAPSIVRDGDDFYMTYSSYAYFPGLRIWHSKDLRHLEPIGFALHKMVWVLYSYNRDF